MNNDLARARQWAQTFYKSASDYAVDRARIYREVAAIPHRMGSPKWRKAYNDIYAKIQH
jgi:hypothetical protein